MKGVWKCGVLVMMLVLCPTLKASTDILTAQSLLNQLNQFSELRIIISFDSVSRNVNQSPVKLNSLLMAQQESLLGSLSTNDYQHVRHFKHTSQMAMTVNRSALQSLLHNKTVRINADELKKPFLSQSVKLVYPSQDISPYDGNNQWAVAVLDSGVDKNHPFLAGKIISEACYSDGGGQPGTFSLCPGNTTSSTAPGSGLPCPASIVGCDHGTQVAGIAVGNGTGFDGVARSGKLISIQVFSRINDFDFCFPYTSCIGAYTSDVIAGLERVYALRNTYKIAAVNLSLGFGGYSGACDSEPEKPIIDLLKNAKIPTIAATGNDGSPSMIASPACISSAIAVGSSRDTTDVASSFSNNSVMLDVYAPGESITTSVPGGSFATEQGTSFAAPHVAGAWAVFKHASPDSSVDQIENLIDAHGSIITISGVTRRRLDVTGVLNTLSPGSQYSSSIIPMLLILLLE